MLKLIKVKSKYILISLVLITLGLLFLPQRVVAQGYSGCLYLWSPFSNSYVCVRDINNYHCDSGYTDICNQFNNDQSACENAYHECVLDSTPTPISGYYTCSWLYSPLLPGWVCVLNANHCTSGLADCSLYQNQVSCELATHMCVAAPSSTPPSTTGIINWSELDNSMGSRYKSSDPLGNVISGVLTFIFPISGLILLIIIIISGFKMMTSAGDPKKIVHARSILTSASIGFIIIFTAYWITYIIGNILGLSDIARIF